MIAPKGMRIEVLDRVTVTREGVQKLGAYVERRSSDWPEPAAAMWGNHASLIS